MCKLLTLLILIMSSFISFGHNPLSAKYHLAIKKEGSILTINLSQDGVNAVLLKHNSKTHLEGLNDKEFKQLIINYIKSNFNIYIDREKVVLKEGGIRYGHHQTDVKFVLPSFSKKTQKIFVDIPAFSENNNHQTLFVYDFYGKREKAILSSKNEFKANILLKKRFTFNKTLLLTISSITSLLFVFLLITNKTKKH